MKRIKNFLACILSAALITLSPGYGAYQAAAAVVTGNSAAAAAPGASMGAVGAMRLAPSASAGLAPLSPSLALPVIPTGVVPALNASVNSGVAVNAAASVNSAAGVNAAGSRVAASAVSAQTPSAAQPGKAAAVTSAVGRSVSAALERAPEASSAKAQTAFSGLARELPKFSEMGAGASKAAAHDDFLSRVGSFRSGDAGASAVASGRALGGLSRSGLLSAKDAKGSKDEAMPDYQPGTSGDRRESFEQDLDDLGNPKRGTGDDANRDKFSGESGPSRGFDEGGGGSGNSNLFGGVVVGAGLFTAQTLAALTVPQVILAYLLIALPALVLHEMSHAWLADKLGDPGPRLAGRSNFKFWTKTFWSDAWNHVNAPLEIGNFRIPLGLSFVLPVGLVTISMLTLGVPLLFGGARPVNVNPYRLSTSKRSETKGMAMVAATGPLTHLSLALGFGAVAAVLTAAGVGGIALTFVSAAIWVNVLLALFNALPFFPLDGHHLARSVLADAAKKPELARDVFGEPSGRINNAARMVNIYALVGTLAFLFNPVFLPAVNWVTGFLLGAGGLFLAGTLKGRLGESTSVQPPNSMAPAAPGAAPTAQVPGSKLLVVHFTGTERRLTSNVHSTLVDTRGGDGINRLRMAESVMQEQLNLLGLGFGMLAQFGAQPVATYKDINTATIRVREDKAEALTAALASQGHTVYDNDKERREIIRPIEDDPAQPIRRLDAGILGPVTMAETLTISTMDKVHEEARQRWGSPNASKFQKMLLGWLGAVAPQPKIGVIDTGVEKNHKLIAPHLAGAKDTRESGTGADDNGHGSWVTSMVAWFAPWTKNITHYKAFTNGGATLDDVLKGLTMAADDGNIVISNSWGSDGGDPNSPDSLLVKKLAEKGHIMVFAAGNAGSGANTIGSPAIVHYRTAEGVQRVISVAATNREKRVSSFSSRGAGSPKTKKTPGYPRKPDIAEQGENTEGAWMGGRTRAISGTSMSTPKLAGTIAMLAMLFGVTATGPALDKIVKAVFDTVTNEHKQKPEDVGDGFSSAYAAYQALRGQGILPVKRGFLSRLVIWLLDRGAARSGPPGPRPPAPPRPGSDQGEKLLSQI